MTCGGTVRGVPWAHASACAKPGRPTGARRAAGYLGDSMMRRCRPKSRSFDDSAMLAHAWPVCDMSRGDEVVALWVEKELVCHMSQISQKNISFTNPFPQAK